MASGDVLISAVLLIFCIAVSTAGENDLLVMTTADRLREELRKEMSDSCNITALNKELKEYIDNGIREAIREELRKEMSDSCNVTALSEELKEYIDNGVREAIKQTLTDFLPVLPPTPTSTIASGFIPSSCAEVLQLAPNSSSGYYLIRGTDDDIVKHVYCDMERSCKGVGGGWMKVASINMYDSNSECPSGLRTLETYNKRRCAKTINCPACSSAMFSVQGVQYSKVCGKIIGYQDNSPDAFTRFISGQNTIDDNYVDGISLTHGSNPRKHIWTFAAALHEHSPAHPNVCPCTNNQSDQTPYVPYFIREDYFCDTGSENHFEFIFYPDDPLWDGKGCGQNSTCCTFNSPPWFLKDISPPTDEDIEIRLCSDQPDEDINFETLEIYIQ